jgi:hypothetical protein
MDKNPDYSNYSLAELYDVAQHINKERYPDRYALVAQEILRREQFGEYDSPPTQTSKGLWRGCMRGGCFGTLLGLGVGIWWGQVYVPTGPIYGDGMDRGFGLMGFALFGILIGGASCAFIGALMGDKH